MNLSREIADTELIHEVIETFRFLEDERTQHVVCKKIRTAFRISECTQKKREDAITSHHVNQWDNADSLKTTKLLQNKWQISLKEIAGQVSYKLQNIAAVD